MYLVIFQLSKANSSKIDITFFRESLTILQGGSDNTKIKVKNIHNETLAFVTPKFDKPSGIEISTSPELYTGIGTGSLGIFNFNVSVNKDLRNGTYTIRVWIESEATISGESVKSEKYPFNVTVLFNPEVVTTTTSTSITTTTMVNNVTGATTTGVTETTETIAKKKYEVKITPPKTEHLMILAGVVVILILIPYFTFKKKKI